MTVIKTQIFQPSIPAYRVSLFAELVRLPDLDVRIYASAPSATDAINSDSTLRRKVNTNLQRSSYFRNRLVWQHPARLDPDLNIGDVLVLSGNPRFLSNFALLAQARKRGVGIVWWGHGWTAGANPATASIRRRIMRLADVWLLYTDREVADYQQFGFDTKRLFATNNTIDHRVIDTLRGRWNSNRLEEFRSRERLGSSDVLLFCGRLTSKTRLDLALYAMRYLVDAGWRVTLVIVGDGPMREQFQQLASSLGVEDNVRWQGAVYDEEQLAPWFLTARAFVYPGAIGLSLNHAFAYGLPVITHDNPRNQMPEFAALKLGKNGITFRENDPRDLADKIRCLLSNPEKCASMGREALTTLHMEYSFEGMVNRFADAIRTAAAISLERSKEGGTG